MSQPQNSRAPHCLHVTSVLVWVMKTKLLIIFASAGAFIQSGAYAGDAQIKAGAQAGSSDASIELRADPQAGQLRANASAGQSHLLQASELIGSDVRNQQDEKLGDIKDVMIDLQSGKAPFAVFSSGGFFGVGDRLMAVPISSFKQNSGQDQFVLNMDRERLQSAPSFDKGNWPDMSDESWSSGVYTYYGAQPMESGVAVNTTTRTEINEAAGADSSWVPGRAHSESVTEYHSNSRIPGHSDSLSQSYGETTTGLSRDRTPRQGLGAEDLTKNQQKIYNPGGYAQSDAFFTESSGAERRRDTTTEERRTRRDYNDAQGANIHGGKASMKSGKITRASELIGMEVKNAQDQRIGEIKDVVIDMQSGRVAYAVMDPDGSLAAADKLFAVPPTVFTRSTDERWLIFNTDKETMMTAPSFEKDNWTQSNNQQFTSEVYRFYHQKPYWQSSRELSEPSGTEQRPYRNDRRDSQELQNDQGANYQNDQDQIEEAAGAEPAAAAPASDPANASDPATEPSSQVEPERNEEVPLSPRAEEQKPDSSAAKETAEVEAAATPDQPEIQEPAGATATTPATSDDQAASDADRRMSQQLRNTLQTDPALSASSSKVKVSAANGRITLRGTVATEEEKQAIAGKAQELVGGAADKVDNQIQVGADALTPPAPVPSPNP